MRAEIPDLPNLYHNCGMNSKFSTEKESPENWNFSDKDKEVN